MKPGFMRDCQIAGTPLELLILPTDGNILYGTPGKLGKTLVLENCVFLRHGIKRREGHLDEIFQRFLIGSKNLRDWAIRSQVPCRREASFARRECSSETKCQSANGEESMAFRSKGIRYSPFPRESGFAPLKKAKTYTLGGNS